MAKDAFDLLSETVSDMNKMLINLATKVSAHGVWIKIYSAILLAVIAGLVRLLMEKL